ncbi:MAG TPA: hypothetical protein VGL77_06910 [Armatimonadota bacterium]
MKIASRPDMRTLIRQYRRTLVLAAGIGLLLGGVMAALRPLTYSASATLLFPSLPGSTLSALTGGGGGGDLPSVPLLGGALITPQPGTSAATASVLLQSHRAADDVIKKLDLKGRWGLSDDRAVLRRFTQRLQCKAGKSGELYIGFQDKSAKTAYEIADAVVCELQQLSHTLGLNPAEENVTFLEQQEADARRKFMASQQAMMAFQRANQMPSLPDQAKLLITQYAQVQDDLTKARLEADAADRQLHLVSGSTEKMIKAYQDPTATGDGALSRLYQRVKQGESELVLLRERLTPNHPDVQSKKSELNEAKRQLHTEIGRQVALVKSGNFPVLRDAVVGASLTRARVAGLQSAADQLHQIVGRLPQQQAEYTLLSAELDANGDAVKLFHDELEKARILASRNGPLFVVADPPSLPLERDPAHRLVILILALFLGLGVGLLFPYFAWYGQLQAYEESRWASRTDTDERARLA